MSWKDLITWNRKKEDSQVPIHRSETKSEAHPAERFHHDMNRLFDDFFKDFGWPTSSLSREWGTSFSPSINVSEGDKSIEISAELPGMDEKDIQVSLTKDILTIKGEKKQEKEEKNKEYYHVERSYGSFQRSLQLPCEIEADKIKADFKKGVLNIKIPKSKEAQEKIKKIEIQGD